MRQLSLLADSLPALADAMPAIRAAMRRAVGEPDSEGRKMLADKLNRLAKQEEVTLTSGNTKEIHKDTLDKWLSPSDTGHPPSVNAILAFCRVTGSIEPLRIMLRAVDQGLDIMTLADKRFRDIGKADEDMRAARKRKKQAEESPC